MSRMGVPSSMSAPSNMEQAVLTAQQFDDGEDDSGLDGGDRVSASRVDLPDHLDEDRPSVLRGTDLAKEVDSSTLNPICRLQP